MLHLSSYCILALYSKDGLDKIIDPIHKLECDYQLGLLVPEDDTLPSVLRKSVGYETYPDGIVLQTSIRSRSMVYWLRELVKTYPQLTVYSKWIRVDDSRTYMAAGHRQRFTYVETDETGENLSKGMREAAALVRVVAEPNQNADPGESILNKRIYDFINRADGKFRSCILQ